MTDISVFFIFLGATGAAMALSLGLMIYFSARDERNARISRRIHHVTDLSFREGLKKGCADQLERDIEKLEREKLEWKSRGVSDEYLGTIDMCICSLKEQRES